MRGDARIESVNISNVPILIDGNNVVREDRQYGWRVLKTLLDWLDDNKKEWFLYFDANIWYVKELKDDGKAYIESLVNDARAKVCPSRAEADSFILLHADKTGSHIISNDGYKKWEIKYPWIAARTQIGNLRVYKFAVVGDILELPDFGIWERIVADENKAQEAYAANIKVLRKAAECGDAEAQYRIGLCHFVGKGVDSKGRIDDLENAEKWLRKAVAHGHSDAQRSLGSVQSSLGSLHFYGWGVVSADKREAVKWYHKAAESGDPQAQYRLGLCYYNGEGVQKDKTEAVKWYRKAAEQGHIKAQHDLSICCSIGDGVEQDLDEAEKWCRKIIELGDDCAEEMLKEYCCKAEQGDPIAQYQMGMLYSGEDNNLTYNPWLGAKWFRMAAEQGHLEAQYQLGECYYERFNDFGIEENESESIKWYRKAAEQGHVAAQEKLYSYGWSKS